ncbi:family 16 glycosylhydrolase [Streptacidiphilus sp. P02-A3a]|uniref:glycoside hydrolase family 16 protein n=1 Tax=Streptacidiphilus sp. P02-A3a TaxID=2704468 RepID=UPI0015FC805C|nr:family 16 glycosylhydrolase [Streptacidiphilus sp. P02-A3a]QMU71160.1 family 16 glycosylhydrolase [Streptacidiphilus sp. P02-A3a]
MRISPVTSARFGAIAGTAALVAVPLAGQAHAATAKVTQDRLTPTSMTAGTAAEAGLTVHSGACFTARTLGVGVRDAAGDNLDFPGAADNVRICPGGLSITTGSRTLAAGTYTQFGFWQDTAGAWHNLPSRTLTVAASTTPPATPTPPSTGSGSPVPGQSLVWSEEFNGPVAYGSRWIGDSTTAFQYGNHNPNDNKLDWLSDSAVSVAGGVATFTAAPSGNTLENGKQAWTTGLLTTEGSTQGFQVKTGDYAETRVRLPTAAGAWPALWTWKNGNGEIDSFEYHPDNPNLLEFTNHVNPAQNYYTDASAVAPGKWVTIGTYYGANSVDWYVNGTKVYADGTGVGPNWSAYLILSLSVSAGEYHPAPTSSSPITFAADYVRVYG